MRIALENEIGFEITGITKLFHVPFHLPSPSLSLERIDFFKD